MTKLKEIIIAFEWAWQTKPRLLALGVLLGASIMWTINSKENEIYEYNLKKLKDENERLKEEVKQSQKDCLEKIKEVKEFLKYIAE